MDFLVLGLPPVSIPITSAEWTPVNIGVRKRMYLGNLMVRNRGRKWEARMSTPPMPVDLSEEVQAALYLGVQNAGGEVITRRGYATMSVECEVTRVEPVRDGVDFQEVLEFTMREV